jgi:hypothetical protein
MLSSAGRAARRQQRETRNCFLHQSESPSGKNESFESLVNQGGNVIGWGVASVEDENRGRYDRSRFLSIRKAF